MLKTLIGASLAALLTMAGLPLTQPLRNMGLNTSLIDRWLRPQIDRAYFRRPQVEAGGPTAPLPAEPAQPKVPLGTPVAAEATPATRKAPDRQQPTKSVPAQRARDKTADATRQSTETSAAKPETKASAAKDTTAATGAKPTGSTKDKAAKPQSDSKVSPAREH